MATTASEWLLDTSIFVDVLRGVGVARDWIDSIPKGQLYLSVITAAELLAGCRSKAEQRVIERELALYDIVWLTEAVSETALEWYKQYRLSHGTGFLDCLIGASASHAALTLATLNIKHFPFPDLQAVRPY